MSSLLFIFFCLKFRLKDSERLPATNKYSMRIKDGIAYLIIHEVVERDKGVYTCEASNQYGRVATSAELYLAGLQS